MEKQRELAALVIKEFFFRSDGLTLSIPLLKKSDEINRYSSAAEPGQAGRRQSIIGSNMRVNHHNIAPCTPFRVLPTAFFKT
jgi:hypothetical protein